MRWLLLLVFVVWLIWLGWWDVTTVVAAFVAGVLLADDVRGLWRRIGR